MLLSVVRRIALVPDIEWERLINPMVGYMKPTLYMETSVPSYYTALPSRDIVVLAHQEITREWWNVCIFRYEVFVSELVIREALRGDPEAAKRRVEAITLFPVLEITPEAERLAGIYLRKIPILRESLRDALHLAIASAHGIDYLVTWNCTHIARGEVKKALEQINDLEGIVTPTICTPEELTGG